MRILQIVVRKLLGLALLALGGVFAVRSLSQVYGVVIRYAPDNDYLRMAVGVCFALVGLLTLLPLLPARRRKTISFPGTHGRVAIRIDSVESSLNRVIGKMAEVKKINVTVVPVEDNRKVRINADLTLFKTADSDLRDIEARITDRISTTAANILGVDEITSVNLNVNNIIVDAPGGRGRKAEAQPEPKTTRSVTNRVETTPSDDVLPGQPLPGRTEDEEPSIIMTDDSDAEQMGSQASSWSFEPMAEESEESDDEQNDLLR